MQDFNTNDTHETMALTTEFLKNNQVDSLIRSFAAICELYTVVLDINGKVLLQPDGPVPFLGEFYEMVRNPKYRDTYDDVTRSLAESGQTMFGEVDDGNRESRFAAAPIFLDGVYLATWILYAENQFQSQKLFKAYEHFGRTAASLSHLITNISRSNQISEKEEEVQKQLKFEHESRVIMSDILEAVSGGDKKGYGELYERVGKLMDVDYMVYYAIDDNRPGYMKLVDYWSRTGKSAQAENGFTWDRDHYNIELQNKIKKEGLFIDSNNMTNQMRVEIFEGKVKAVMVLPIYTSGVYHGRLIFIENRVERVWTKDEIGFAKEIASVISRDVTNDNRVRSNVKVARILSDVLEHLPVFAFVRDANDGSILYANSLLREKMGNDIVGNNSFSIIPDVKQEFAGLAGIDTAYAPKLNRNTRYNRYIDRLGGIFDVTEHQIKWKNGQKVSVIILKPDASNEVI
ncbi:MAG: hypothetical protein K6E10_09675 [Eubacterium sp.]|nr:hypothetical protein [Eubacterium sp.]